MKQQRQTEQRYQGTTRDRSRSPQPQQPARSAIRIPDHHFSEELDRALIQVKRTGVPLVVKTYEQEMEARRRARERYGITGTIDVTVKG